MDAIRFEDFLSLRPFLEQLQEGFLVFDPHRKVKFSSRLVRQLVGQRALKSTAEQILGDVPFKDLCAPVLSGEAQWIQWREISLPLEDESHLDVAACSVAVAFGQDQRGVMMVLLDISSEVAMHKKYKNLLEKQRQINRGLRQEIATQLRQHEDDIAQFTEILQLAPAIFATFINEAKTAVSDAEKLLQDDMNGDSILTSFRSIHTLKGNARSLGLHLIGGRAHTVEELLEKIRASGTPFGENREALAEILEDLRRAIDRALSIRELLGEATAHSSRSSLDADFIESMIRLEELLKKATGSVAQDHEAQELLQQANEVMTGLARTQLQPLYDYLRLMVGTIVKETDSLHPIVETDGGQIEIPLSVYKALTIALPHLIRNAIIHGIETGADRVAQGKSAAGRIRIVARQTESELEVRVLDDGRGLDLERIRQQAIRQGLVIPSSAQDLANLVFQPALSTAESVNMDAGRGVGTSASEAAVKAVGGDVQARIREEGGTEFLISIPCSPTTRSP